MGLFSRKKKSQGTIHMCGFPGHVDTCKCLYLAAEKSMHLDTELLDITTDEHKKDNFCAKSPFGKIPCLDEGDLVMSGASAVLSFIDIRGGGQSLTPKKAARLGEQNYWIEVGNRRMLPNINTLLDEHILKPMVDSGYKPDQANVDSAISEIDTVLHVLNNTLENRDYIAEVYSFAEIHWVPYLHFCDITGHIDLIEQYPHLKRWFDQIKLRKYGNQATYDVLPGLEQIRGKELLQVA